MEDPQAFYKEYILKEPRESSSSSVFDEGTYAHSLLLEPDMIDKEFRFFDGWRKQGADWEEFKRKNKGYIILSKPQRKRVEAWAKSAKDLPAAMDLLSGGFPEYTVAMEFKNVNLKARADYINIDKGYIADVKTTAYPTDVDSFKETIAQYKYDLSAALYCMLFEAHYGKPFDFYFIVLGKKDKDCQVYKLSKRSMLSGKLKVIEAIELFKKCQKTQKWELTRKDKDVSMDYEILEV